jgi:trehalose-6-phosphatase
MPEQQLKDINPQPESIVVGDKVIVLRPPDLNALAEIEEYFGISFSEIESRLSTTDPKFFRNVRAITTILIHMDYPEVTEREVGKSITMDNLEILAEALSSVFGKALPLGEANIGESKET